MSSYKKKISTLNPSQVNIIIKSNIRATSGLFVLLDKIQGYCLNRKIDLKIHWESEQTKKFLNNFKAFAKHVYIKPTRPRKNPLVGLVEKIGWLSIAQIQEIKDFIIFTGKFSLCCVKCFSKPGRFRLSELLYNLDHVGTRAMVIVGTMSALVGLVTAFQASIQLRQFGANIFVADLVALAMIRELSPLITAILMAGRTTSAFTAEIGTMKINEELDSLKTINVDPFYFLVIPKTISSVVAGPLLTIWSVFTGFLGGMTVAFLALEVTPSSFLQAAHGILTISDLWVGFLKSLVFSFIVGMTGCFMGLETGHGADAVGRQTTKAVVRTLFSIVIADAFITLLSYAFNW